MSEQLCNGCMEPSDFCTCPTPEQQAEKQLDPGNVKPVARDEFGSAVLRLIRRMKEIGTRQAIDEQLNAPFLHDDPRWIDTVHALADGRPFIEMKSTDSDKLYVDCPACSDTGFVITELRPGYSGARPCTADFCKRSDHAVVMFEKMQADRSGPKVNFKPNDEPHKKRDGFVRLAGGF